MMPQDTVFIFNIVDNNVFYYLFLTKIPYSSLRPGRDEAEKHAAALWNMFLKKCLHPLAYPSGMEGSREATPG